MTQARIKILLVEDDAATRMILSKIFHVGEFDVQSLPSGEKLLEQAFDASPDVVLLDLGLPGIQGLDVLRIIKKDARTSSAAVLVLSSRGHEATVVEALSAGADGYVVKPCRSRELVWRVKAALRARAAASSSMNCDETPPSVLGALELDHETLRVRVKGRPVRLTPKEFRILERLAHSRGRVVNRLLLAEAAWGVDTEISTRVVDLYVSRLRRKLGRHKSSLETIPSLGYRLIP